MGRYLAEPLLARRTQPAADLSAMDGYAVSSYDLHGPWRLVGESAAGHPYSSRVRKGEAIRIATGALVPDGTGCVILQEDVARSDDFISLAGALPSPPGKHIRRNGMDFRSGDTVLKRGVLLGPAQIALAVTSGHRHIPVHRVVRVAVIDSGDELATGLECPSHQIPASNGIMLAAMIAGLPCRVTRLGPVPDDMTALSHVLAEAQEADIVVTTGGASVGDHDLIRPALENWGATLDFWRVAIKPGKPILVARRQSGNREQFVLGLPGNPVSAFVTAHLFLLPLIRAASGAERPLPVAVKAQLATPVPATGKRREFLRGRWDGTQVRVQQVQDSGALAALAESNVLIDRPAGSHEAEAGATVSIYPFASAGNA